MDRPQFLQRVIEWLRAGYPDGVPQGDYIPLVALLRRQLTDDEVAQVADALITDAPANGDPISKVDAAVKIIEITQEMPHEDDIARVRDHLEASGWPFDDSPLTPPTDPSSTDPTPPSTGRSFPSSGRDNTTDPDAEPGEQP